MNILSPSCLAMLLLLPVPTYAQQPASALSHRVTTVAGAARQPGSSDGTGRAARFNRPTGIAVATDGAVYIADTDNHTIRRITPLGAVTTLAGTAGSKGHLDGQGTAARFNRPVGLAIDASGTLYVADGENHIIRKITLAGSVTTLAGKAGRKGSTNGQGDEARFNYPHALAVDTKGIVYVADTESHTIRCITAAGVVTTLAGAAGQKGAIDGENAMARFSHPSGIAVDSAGIVYVAENGTHTIRKITPAGHVATLAGMAGQNGAADGTGAAARFDTPNGIAADARGTMYVADYVSSTIRRITPAGEVTTIAGSVRGWGSQDGVGKEARFNLPFGVAVGAGGRVVYVTDTQNGLIRCIQ
ncbi:NHL repeat-containing protein [Hymenobacter elongatus]|uniref:SMP-30/Gluconolactonase/LRE-like region domain-containing protein n=1 Tax=Hymenobacter elongatus TaxID=877208 RepID=A0A4Z0PN39_9BACT|nr:NHL repeat-containing protein [Hymenobacter elongatus]TGE18058.1 hypothetical protein E5J99_05850 [Hymenobacter elongatus]